MRKAEPTMGQPTTIWERFWQSSTRALDACEQHSQRQKKKGATDDLASSEADFVKDLFVGSFRRRGDNEPSIMAVAERVEGEDARHEHRDTGQRATVSRKGATRTIGEHPRTLRNDTQNHDKTQVTQDHGTGTSWIVVGEETHKRGHCVGQGNQVRSVREEPQAFRWFKARRDGGENSQKTGPTNRAETSLLLEIQGSTPGQVPNAPRRGKTARNT